jgi:hypothetical protein
MTMSLIKLLFHKVVLWWSIYLLLIYTLGQQNINPVRQVAQEDNFGTVTPTICGSLL